MFFSSYHIDARSLLINISTYGMPADGLRTIFCASHKLEDVELYSDIVDDAAVTCLAENNSRLSNLILEGCSAITDVSFTKLADCCSRMKKKNWEISKTSLKRR